MRPLLFLIMSLTSLTNWALASGPSFDEVCYLARYPDVVAGWVNKGLRAEDHWIQYGQHENRIAGCTEKVNAVFKNNFPHSVTFKSDFVLGSPIEITSFPAELGGAIGALRWNGVDFINRVDHGRELQSAASFDGHGECYNPTEAGSAQDSADKNELSSSVLKMIRYSPGVWQSTSQMAFWLFGPQTGGGCAQGPQVNQALSPHQLDKKIQLNYHSDPSVIEYSVSFANPAGIPTQTATYEILTGYMTTDFSRFVGIDPKIGAVEETNFKTLSGPGYPKGTFFLSRENTLRPIIASLPSGSHAMGVIFPSQKISGDFQGFSAWRFEGSAGVFGSGSNKWNLAVIDNSPAQLKRNFRVLLVIGPLDLVIKKMKTLIQTEGIYEKGQIPKPMAL